MRIKLIIVFIVLLVIYILTSSYVYNAVSNSIVSSISTSEESSLIVSGLERQVAPKEWGNIDSLLIYKAEKQLNTNSSNTIPKCPTSSTSFGEYYAIYYIKFTIVGGIPTGVGKNECVTK
jgi:hypothetical protein